MADDPSGSGPLTGVRVLDLTIWMAGPIAGMLLADLGADVIKVESPTGDPARGSGGLAAPAGDKRPGTPLGLSWSTCNRNKRTIPLDLNDQHDREVFNRLVAMADVFLTNLHGRTIEQLNVDAESLHLLNPRLVYARAAGLGATGPRAYDHCQDMTGMAYSGILFTYGSEPGVPFAPPGAMNDVMTGTMTAFGVLAALAERNRTGKGQIVSGSLVQTSLWAQLLQIGTAANTSQVQEAHDRKHPNSPVVNQYRCKEGKWIAVAAVLPRAWPVLLGAIGLEHLEQDERFATPEGRRQHSAELVHTLDAHFATANADDWLARLRAHGLWVSPVNTIADVLTDSHIEANGYLTTLDDGARTVTMPFTLHGYEAPTHAGPALGSHRAEILRELGMEGAPPTAAP